MKLNSTRYYALAVLLIVPCVWLLSFILLRSPKIQTAVDYHGPYPSNNIQATNTAPFTPTATLAPTPKPTVHVLPRPSSNQKNYGIATGGGLMSLSQQELNKYFESLKSLGVRWIRWDADWGVIQRNNSTSFEWEGADRVANTAKQFGIKSLGLITYTPKWAMVGFCTKDSHCAPADAKTFGQFAGIVASRYKGTITDWEIWNEPNYAYTTRWGSDPEIKKYTDILKEAYLAIKTANPQAVVLSGGLAASGNEADGSVSPLTFLGKLYSSGANKYFDAIALHPYTYPASPSYKASWNHWQEMYAIRKLMTEKGDASKKIWVTEYGAPTNGPGESFSIIKSEVKFRHGYDFMTEMAQLDLLIEATRFYDQNTTWLGAFFWYSMQDYSNNRDTPENFFGLSRFDGSRKPAYEAFRSILTR